MKKHILITIVMAIALTNVTAVHGAEPRIIKVGAFNFCPGIFKDTDGVIKGFYVDALADIEKKENIRFDYVYGSWSEGLERIKNGDVDMLTSVAFSADRAKFLEYGKAPLLTVWGELYVPLSSNIDDILAVKGKKIAVMKNDMNARHFIELVQKFGITCEFVEKSDFEEVFTAIAKGNVDAGVVNNTFGAAKQRGYGLRSSGVIFNPFDIFFVVSKGENGDLINLLDRYLNNWRHQPTSAFNTARQKWSHGNINAVTVIPQWLKILVAVIFIVTLGAFAFILLLKKQVHNKTLAISESLGKNQRLTERQNALLAAIPDIIMEVDTNKVYTWANAVGLEFFGDDVIGKQAAFYFEGSQDTYETIKPLLDKSAPAIYVERFQRRKDGEKRLLAWWCKSLRGENGEVSGFLSTARDITEKQRFLEMTQQSQKLESLGVLAGGIAHDFNNLMGGIFGYIDMASEATKEVKVTSYLLKAMNTIDRARALTGQLLTFAKGGAPIQKIDNLFPFVEETAKFALSGANVSCHLEVQQDLWACNFDKNQIGQVIDNLIINAQQAMPVGGTIELTARNIVLSEKEHPLLKNGNYVKISVKDTGVGIFNEHLTKIFDPFFTTKPKGHGLGLATCYSIIKRHEGCIDVESEPGKGSTFNVYLPASTEVASCVTMNTAKMHKGSGTFLIMDDEEVMRDTIRDMLESLGYTVISKENGKDAIDFFATENKANRIIAGMIFDLTVPGGMGGKATIEEIRKTNREIPVFVASGYADDPVMRNPIEHGFMASICKPFRKSELSEMLNKYIKPKK